MKISKHLVDSMTGRLTEPKPTGRPVTKIELVTMLNFYAANHRASQKKEWLLEWAEKLGEFRIRLPSIRKINDGYLETWGTLARLITNGHDIGKEYHDRICIHLNKLLEDVECSAEKPEEPKVESWAPVFDQALALFDSAVDDVMSGASVDFDATTVKPKQIQAEADRLLAATDDMQPRAARRLQKWLSEIVARVSEAATQKKTRVTRIRKISPEKMTKNVKFATDHEAIKFKTLRPVDVVGKKKMYLFHTKYRKLICVHAQPTGFAFKGSTLLGYDPDKSTSKALRNPDSFFSGYKDAPSISELNKRFKEINAKPKSMSTGRFGEYTIIIGAS